MALYLLLVLLFPNWRNGMANAFKIAERENIQIAYSNEAF